MQRLRSLTPLVLPVPLIAGLALADDLRGEAEVGRATRYTLALSVEAESTLIEQFIGDEAQQADGVLEYSQQSEVELLDRVVEVADGHVTALVREYASLTRSETDNGGTTDSESGLDGAVLRFEREGPDGEVTISATEESVEVDEELFEELSFEVDLGFLLPDETVEEGDTWELEAVEARRVFRPAGGLSFEREDQEGEDPADEAVEDMWASLEGEFEVEYAGTVEEESGSFEAFDVRIEVTGEGELREEIEEEEVTGERFMVRSTELDLEGRLLWDPRLARLHAFVISGSITLGQSFGGDIDTPEGDTMTMGQRIELEGELEITIDAESID